MSTSTNLATASAHEAIDSTHTPPPPTSERKRFLPLENNPTVMTPLIHSLGLPSHLAFHDVYSIDDPDLLAFVPRPALGLLMCFPISAAYVRYKEGEDRGREDYRGDNGGESVWGNGGKEGNTEGKGQGVVWWKQTIANACGLYGVLHCVCNGEARGMIAPDSPLASLLASALPLPPTSRSHLLETSPTLAAAHAAAAATGDTATPALEDEVDIHFVCFVKGSDGHLWELDGARKGPLDRGALGEGEDVLSEGALEKGVRRFLRREEEEGKGEGRFSLLALGPAMD